jgi:hypothetical protein
MPDVEVTLDSTLDDHLRLEALIEKSAKAQQKQQEDYQKGIERSSRLLDKQIEAMTKAQNQATISALSQTLAKGANLGLEYQAKPPSFLESIMKSATGPMGTALMAGGAAGGVLMLADAIKDLTKQSKILNDVQSNLTKSVSLLVDLVLLPFLPLIYGGIVMLYSGIVGFGTWWKDVWDTLKKEGLIGLVKLGLQWGLETLLDWQKKLTEWLFSDKPLSLKILDMALSFNDLISNFEFLPGISIQKLISWIFGDRKLEISKMAFDLVAGFFDGGLKFIGKLLDFIFGDGTMGKSVIDFTINLVQGAGDWLWKLISGLYNTGAEALSSITGPTINFPVSLGSGSTSTTTTTTGDQNVYIQSNGQFDLQQAVIEVLRKFGGQWFQ